MRMYNSELLDNNICSRIRENKIFQVLLSHHMTLHCDTDKYYSFTNSAGTNVCFTFKLKLFFVNC